MEEEDFDAEPEEVERADEILKRETELPSFCDNGITQCRKITPGDLGILNRRDRGLPDEFVFSAWIFQVRTPAYRKNGKKTAGTFWVFRGFTRARKL